jgi:hypothetical protein
VKREKDHRLILSSITKTHRQSQLMSDQSKNGSNLAEARQLLNTSTNGWNLLTRNRHPMFDEIVITDLSQMFDVSRRQEPVVDMLAELLDHAKATAAAISDNAIEEQRPIPRDLLRSFNNDLIRIKACLITAADDAEEVYASS